MGSMSFKCGYGNSPSVRNCMSRTALNNSNAEGEWWKKTTVYHVYVRSFHDSNGDGVGDIQGIIEKLDYLNDLGYETIWISPFTQSPQKDFGYDKARYINYNLSKGASSTNRADSKTAGTSHFLAEKNVGCPVPSYLNDCFHHLQKGV